MYHFIFHPIVICVVSFESIKNCRLSYYASNGWESSNVCGFKSSKMLTCDLSFLFTKVVILRCMKMNAASPFHPVLPYNPLSHLITFLALALFLGPVFVAIIVSSYR